MHIHVRPYRCRLDLSMATFAALVFATCVALVWATNAHIEERDGDLHINTTDAAHQRIFFNGVDVLHELARTDIALQVLKDRVCSDPPPIVAVPVLEADVSGMTDPLWAASVVAPNGLVFGVPFSASAALIFDPATRAVDLTSIASLPSTAEKWCDGVVADDGRIFMLPFEATSVLIIDPDSKSADITSIATLPPSVRCIGGTKTPSGMIMVIPESGGAIIRINPENHEWQQFDPIRGGDLWTRPITSMVDGKVLSVSRAQAVMVIDNTPLFSASFAQFSASSTSAPWIDPIQHPTELVLASVSTDAKALVTVNLKNTGVIVATPLTPPEGGAVFSSLALAPDGRVFMIPSSATHVAIVDVAARTIDTFAQTDEEHQWWHAMVMGMGKILALPYEVPSTVLVVDPERDTLTTHAIPDTVPKAARFSFPSYASPNNDNALVVFPYSAANHVLLINAPAIDLCLQDP
ncbi:hypothetical protein PTSG_09700 [Salpingoeca rosetta]|uniref:Uncharacterized protein n=1 Tax=Salpingoeca rosetta (strain ATCC 50818 / BSB-021) TaxID=946362 RepID=F2UNS9_SALR5|nr:uncharacterized protein PTSG_09700 [Salpingoeca rosetta]EGD79284.1 hypothetical protein PTSG_09700 [Salpingoeca rosetta]|eukprot:XP_004989055.1 hypothetical protein PTSG_09700 [Salpingoeca rosetta]